MAHEIDYPDVALAIDNGVGVLGQVLTSKGPGSKFSWVDPSISTGGITQAQADARYLQLLGTAPMTGPLILASDPVAALGAASKRYVDTAIAAISTGLTQGQADARYVQLSGAVSMSGRLTLSADPTAPLGAATKAYVDAQVITAGAVSSVAGKTGAVTLVHTDIADWVAATASLGAVQSVAGRTGNIVLASGDITNFTPAASAAAPVQSVAGKTGIVVLATTDIPSFNTVAAAAAPVQSVNAKTGTVVIGTADIAGFAAAAAAAAPVQSVATRTGAVTLTHTDITDWAAATATVGAVSSVNGKTGAVVLLPSDITGFNAAAAAAAPVASVAGRTGIIVLGTTDITGFAAGAAAAAPVQSVATRAGAIVLTHNDITDWATAVSTIGGPGGATGQVQINNAGAFAGVSTIGTGNVVLATSPTLQTPTFTGTTSSGPLNVTGAYNLNGTFTQAAVLDPGTFPGNTRWNQWNTTLTPTATITQVFEQNTNAVTLNGPGVYNAEINAGHSFIQVNAGGTAISSETFETSASNFGTMGNFTNYLGIYHNQSTGIVTSIAMGINAYVVNDNPAPGSIPVYVGFNYGGAASGAGSLPTLEYSFRSQSVNAVMNQLGPLSLNFVGSPSAGNLLEIRTTGHAGAQFPVAVKNDQGSTFTIADSGNVTVGGSGVLRVGTNSGNAGAIQLLNNSTGGARLVSGAGAAQGVITVPGNTTDTMALLNTAQTFSNTQTFSGTVLQTSVANSLTAHAGGGQAGALALTATHNVVAVVASDGDSVSLPPSAVGAEIWITNASTNHRIQVFGAGADTINLVAAATGVPLAFGQTGVYKCSAAGSYYGGAVGVALTASIVASAVVANGSIGQIPANAMILGITLTETAGQAVTVQIGTTAGASDLLPATPIAANQLLSISPLALAASAWKTAQALNISSAAWGGASLNAKVWYAI